MEWVGRGEGGEGKVLIVDGYWSINRKLGRGKGEGGKGRKGRYVGIGESGGGGRAQ